MGEGRRGRGGGHCKWGEGGGGMEEGCEWGEGGQL